MSHSEIRIRLSFALLAALAGCALARAQDASAVFQQPVTLKSPMPEITRQSPFAPCLEPAPVVGVEDYQGAYEKSAGFFAQKLEYKSLKAPRYKPCTTLCILPVSQKFELFARQVASPGTVGVAVVNAGIYQAMNQSPSYGQGAAGYFRRFGASVLDQAGDAFFKTLVYPTIFREDPRYYRLGRGPVGIRFLHAIEHSVIAHREDGRRTFNFTEWLGTGSAAALSNTYHPDYQRGWGPGAQRVVITVYSWDTGMDLLREFWPEFAHKLHLPHPGAAANAKDVAQ